MICDPAEPSGAVSSAIAGAFKCGGHAANGGVTRELPQGRRSKDHSELPGPNRTALSSETDTYDGSTYNNEIAGTHDFERELSRFLGALDEPGLERRTAHGHLKVDVVESRRRT
jgi:hypothetical protein